METTWRHAGDNMETKLVTNHGDKHGDNNGDKWKLNGTKCKLLRGKIHRMETHTWRHNGDKLATAWRQNGNKVDTQMKQHANTIETKMTHN